MRFFSAIILVMLLCINNICASETHNDPVIKIRLNTQNIGYEKKLAKVVDKVFEVESKAKFVLVSVMKPNSKELDKVFVEKKVQEISAKLKEYGVHEKNIKYKSVLDKNVINNEIHIFLSV